MHLEILIKLVIVLILILLTLIAVYSLQTCCVDLWVTILIKTLTCLEVDQVQIIWLVHFVFDHIEDCCIYGTVFDDTYIWPLYGDVDNCIMHFTNTYG